MTQVSRYPVHKAVEKRMFEIFERTISQLKNSEEITDFLEDFLSPVERIMLAKRLSIAVLLGKGYTYPSISRILRVTSTTIATVSLSLKYSGKGYKNMVNRILRDEKIDDFWKEMEETLAKIPAGKGKDWSYWRGENEKKIRNKRKAF